MEGMYCLNNTDFTVFDYASYSVNTNGSLHTGRETYRGQFMQVINCLSCLFGSFMDFHKPLQTAHRFKFVVDLGLTVT